jgi:hypothetical protein
MGKAPCWRFKHLKDSTRASPAKRKITNGPYFDGRRAEINRLLLHKNVCENGDEKEAKTQPQNMVS